MESSRATHQPQLGARTIETNGRAKDEPNYSIVVRDRDGSERSAAFYSEARRDRFGARIEAEGGRVIHKGTQN